MKFGTMTDMIACTLLIIAILIVSDRLEGLPLTSRRDQ